MKHCMVKGSKYIFLMPSLFFFGISMFIPFLTGLNVAFTNWDGLSKNYDYVGFDNFRLMFSDKNLIVPIKNTIYYALFVTVFNNIITLFLAIMLNRKFRGRNIFRTIFFVPTCLSAVLAAFTWSFIYREVFQTVFGINSPLGSMKYVIPGIAGITLWNSCGINLIIYLAALANVPNELTEAALIDGAGQWRKFWNITVPMIMPAFSVCVTLTLTYSLREFAMPMAATSGGGPARASETMAIYIYNNLYAFNRAGYGQAVAFVFMIFLILIGYSVSRIFRSREVEL